MQSVLLRLDESINLVEFINRIQSIYGYNKVESLSHEIPAKPFGSLPDIFLNPITANSFHMYSREELNER